MIPGTLLGALFLAACLVPGFVFVRVAEHRRGQLARSSLVEAVELAGAGAAASLVSAMAILGACRWIGFLDAADLARAPGRYLLLHPFRGLGSALATFVLSCLLAWLAAHVFFVKRQAVFKPGGSAWARVFYEDRPPGRPEVVVTVELKDGRRLMGRIRTFSYEVEESRELALQGPLASRAGPSAPVTPMPGDFIVIREDAIASITGVYTKAPSQDQATKAPSQDQATKAPSQDQATKAPSQDQATPPTHGHAAA